MVKLDSVEDAKYYGLYTLPAVVHFEEGIPNVYDDDMTKEDVMTWLTDQKTGSYIEKTTPALLQVSIFTLVQVFYFYMITNDPAEPYIKPISLKQ